jgi:glycosyltransferase involved in cell wall biosynthesis
VIVGFHSPLPPARTGVADYAAALLAALKRHGTVEVDSRDADVCLYHLGNNPLHAGIYRRALEKPGVIVLHDAVLHHFFLGSLDERSYVEEFVYNYGEWHRDLARELWAGRSRSGSDHRYYEYPMLRRVAEASRAVIVHNPAAARMVLAHAPNARVHEVPHLFVPPPHIPASEALRFRQELRIAPRAFLFAVLGYLRESKRVTIILRAFDEVRRQGVDAALVMAGEFVSSDLARATAPLMDRPDILRLGRLPERDFWLLAAATDACINLRYPAAGETSGIAIRLMGLGKPVVVTESEEVSRFPEAACLRVAPGVAEKAELVHYMILLARLPGLARDIGRRAAAHIEERHSVERVADSYWEILCACRD